MKILFVVEEFPVLSETFIINQITGLMELGHEVEIFATSMGTNSIVHRDIERYNLLDHSYYRQMPRNLLLRYLKGFRVFSLSCLKNPRVILGSLNVFKYGRKAASLRLLYDVVPLLGKPTSYDIIHCHFGPNGLRAELLRNLGILHGKLVTTFHGYDLTKCLREFGRNFYARLFSGGDLFMPISERWKKLLIELGCEEKRIVVHRMGIDCEKFLFKPRQLIDNDCAHLVSIGRLVEKKGFEYSIRAAARLAKINRLFEYTIVGDGPLREYLQSLINDLSINDKVKLLGPKRQEEVIEILNKAHILVAPSVTAKDGDQEGIPVTLMEAMAMGLPVVSTNHSGIPEVVENRRSGFLVTERDEKALFSVLKYLTEHYEIWPTMGKHGRGYIEKFHDVEKLNDQLLRIYLQLLNEGPR